MRTTHTLGQTGQTQPAPPAPHGRCGATLTIGTRSVLRSWPRLRQITGARRSATDSPARTRPTLVVSFLSAGVWRTRGWRREEPSDGAIELCEVDPIVRTRSEGA